jgi:hypothetical protein
LKLYLFYACFYFFFFFSQSCVISPSHMQVEFILAPSILNVGFFMKNTMNKISSANATHAAEASANASFQSANVNLLPTVSASSASSLANSMSAKDRLKREASSHTMLHSAKSTANIRDFASSATTAARNFSQSPPLGIVTAPVSIVVPGREKRLGSSSESMGSTSPYAGQATTPLGHTSYGANALAESDAGSTNASSTQARSLGLTSLTERLGDTTPRTANAMQPRDPPQPLPSEQDVLSIENHIGRPVIVWWTADTKVDVEAIMATDYTRVREWRDTYPRVVPKNQVAAFPVKSFSRETQETDTKLSFYIQTEQVSKPIHGLQWNAVETHIRYFFFCFFLRIFSPPGRTSQRLRLSASSSR